MYTEEELLEAVDILVEDYGYDEDDAIDMIMESYEEELYNEGVFSGTRVPAGLSAVRGVASASKARRLREKANKYEMKSRRHFQNAARRAMEYNKCRKR